MRWPSTLEWALAALAAALLAILAWNFDPFGRRKHAEAQAAAAIAQSHVEAAASKAVDTYHERTVILRDRADHATQAIQAAPGASDRLPPDVRRAWLDGLRFDAPAADQPSSEPAR